jgi:hypothetical protein
MLIVIEARRSAWRSMPWPDVRFLLWRARVPMLACALACAGSSGCDTDAAGHPTKGVGDTTGEDVPSTPVDVFHCRVTVEFDPAPFDPAILGSACPSNGVVDDKPTDSHHIEQASFVWRNHALAS